MANNDHTHDDARIASWLHGRPATTRRRYQFEIDRLRQFLAGAELFSASLAQLRDYIATLAHTAPRTQAIAAASIKSFYAFHASSGDIERNPSQHLRRPKIPSDLAARILTEADTQRLIAGASTAVDRIMLQLLYLAGIRASELCGLRWRDLQGTPEGGKITVLGKGAKPRTIIIPASLYGDMAVLEPDDAGPDSPIFPAVRDPSRPIGKRQLLTIVKCAANNAGLSPKVSSHWLRHCHASHAIDNGAPITLVRDTLGHANLSITNQYAHARPNDGSARFLPKL